MSNASYRTFRIATCAVLALVLAGCTPTEHASAPQSAPAQVTAPAVPSPTSATAQQQSAPAVPKTPQQQRVQVLIQQVEKSYANGQTDYRKGDLLAAKAEFDRAVDLMLTSGIDIKSEPQLQDEFDHVVDGINSLEMEALKIGNGFVPKEEPTPAEAAADCDIRSEPECAGQSAGQSGYDEVGPAAGGERLRGGVHQLFREYEEGPQHAAALDAARAGRYRAMIQRVLDEEGVPQDLIYLAVAESGFNPRAIGPMTRSGGRAGGMWQFMPNDKFYGLARTEYVDERFDPEKVDPGLCALHEVHLQPAGRLVSVDGGVQLGHGLHAARGAEDRLRDFWELNIPGETKSYVPEIIAAIIVANHPEQYGFDDPGAGPAGADGYSDHQLLRRSAAGVGHCGRAGG